MIDELHHVTNLINKVLLNREPHANYSDYYIGLNNPNDANALLDQHDFKMGFKDDEITNFASIQSLFMASI
jgi:hypothetical protein